MKQKKKNQLTAKLEMRIEMRRNTINMMKAIGIITMVSIFTSVTVHAQDSTKRKTINITSTFKPSLKNTAKLNFNAESPVIDTSRPDLKYSLPVQFLSLIYQPVGLNPLALPADSLKLWKNDNYIKLGAGNVHLPYAQAGLSFGDRQHSFFNVFAEGRHAKIYKE